MELPVSRTVKVFFFFTAPFNAHMVPLQSRYSDAAHAAVTMAHCTILLRSEPDPMVPPGSAPQETR